MKKIIIFFLLGFIWLILPKTSFAADEFSADYETDYDVGIDALTSVTQKITLKNLTNQYYVSNFTLTIGSTTVSDVTAQDGGGEMEVKSEQKGTGTSIDVKFNQQIVGIDKTQTFTLRYKSKDFATVVGKTWEVNLPKMPSASNIDKYNLSLSVPESFGDPTSIIPKPKSQSQSFGKLTFHYSKVELQNKGISVTFGTSQVFDFNMKYDLENNSLIPVITSVTLPADTIYQDIYIDKIIPEPQNVTIDQDGNYLAWYQLERKSKQTVEVSGMAKLYLQSKLKKVKPLTSEEKIELTKSDKYWEKDNPVIKNTLAEIFKAGTPNKTQDKVRLIYEYVVKTLKYDSERVNVPDIERLGAVTALNNPNSAVCMEFTDLFVALSRSAGIPARELDGYAYSQNKFVRPSSLTKDLLHAWGEYFDETKGWVMVDPTWENTSGGVDYFNKFDLSHLTIATKGYSSSAPFISDNTKVYVSDKDFIKESKIDVDINIPDFIWSGLPATANIKVKNIGHFLMQPTSLNIGTSKLSINGKDNITLQALPPFGSVEYQIGLKSPLLINEFQDEIVVNINGQLFTKKVLIKPIFIFNYFPYVFIGLVCLIGLIYFLIFGIHIFQKRSALTSKQ